jgi:hypothetical protein
MPRALTLSAAEDDGRPWAAVRPAALLPELAGLAAQPAATADTAMAAATVAQRADERTPGRASLRARGLFRPAPDSGGSDDCSLDIREYSIPKSPNSRPRRQQAQVNGRETQACLRGHSGNMAKEVAPSGQECAQAPRGWPIP